MQLSDRPSDPRTVFKPVDAVIVGAGVAGLYAIYRLRALGLSIQAFEAAPDVGGTWYWNRYPGARCDVESLEYSYSFSPELMNEWVWSERYATQPEILRYINHVADRFDLRRDIEFNARIVSTRYDEAANRWTLRTADGGSITTHFVVTTVGCLSIPKPPEFEGLEDFAGEWRQTSAWREVDLAGKRVGVVGTGSSGIQAIPVIAQQAAHLTVFQRTPNFSLPAKNGPIDPAFEARVRADYVDYRRRARRTRAGVVPKIIPEKSALEVSKEERDAAYEAAWRRGSAGFGAAFTDIMVNQAANDTAADFVRGKIRQIVKDPAVAERLCPTDHPFATKRICLDSDYFDTFNRPNVTLVDIRAAPIERITRNGVKTAEQEYPLDVLVFATGFDAVTGALLNMNIQGAGGRALKDAWAGGPRTYLGLMVAGFPNLFTVTGPSSPSVLANMIPCVEQHVDWIADCLSHMRGQGLDRIDADPQSQDAWAVEVQKKAEGTLYPRAKSWYLGDNVPGKPRVFLAYVAGFSTYADRCEAVAKAGYEGFHLSAQGEGQASA
jgi:cation diffusion facilitator CzcD-associated flavoprotein CzcO